MYLCGVIYCVKSHQQTQQGQQRQIVFSKLDMEIILPNKSELLPFQNKAWNQTEMAISRYVI